MDCSWIISNDFVVIYGRGVMQKPYVLIYPIAFQNMPSVQATINHGGGGYSSIAVEYVTTTQCNFWAFWEGTMYTGESFSYSLFGY